MEEYRFEKIVNSSYKEQFYSDLYGKTNIDPSHKIESKEESFADKSNIKNKKVLFTTMYGSSYGKAQYSDL